VLVHTGFAISVLDGREAQETLALFAEMEEAARREEEETRRQQDADQATAQDDEEPSEQTAGQAP